MCDVLEDNIVMYLVTRHGVWIDNWIYWTLETCNHNNQFMDLHTQHITAACTKSSQFAVFIRRCFITAPNAIDSSPFVFRGSYPYWLAGSSQLNFMATPQAIVFLQVMFVQRELVDCL
jgi:hypothetical protein